MDRWRCQCVVYCLLSDKDIVREWVLATRLPSIFYWLSMYAIWLVAHIRQIMLRMCESVLILMLRNERKHMSELYPAAVSLTKVFDKNEGIKEVVEDCAEDLATVILY